MNVRIIAAISLSTLVACGSSSSNSPSGNPPSGSSSSGNPDAAIDIITGADALNVGTTDVNALTASSGLPYAAAFAGPVDLETYDFPDQITLRFVRFITDHETNETKIMVVDEIATLDAESATVTFNGETITMALPDPTDDRFEFEGTLNNGQFLFSYLGNQGTFVSDFSLNTYSYDQIGFDSDGFAFVGFETDPFDLTGATGTMGGGTVRYFSDELNGYGNVLTADGSTVTAQEVNIAGTSEIFVDFLDGGVDGTLVLSVAELGAALALGLESTTLSGNGFATVATSVSSPTNCPGCTSATTVGGALYGPDADELGMIAGVDFSSPEDQDNFRVMGVVTSIAPQDP